VQDLMQRLRSVESEMAQQNKAILERFEAPTSGRSSPADYWDEQQAAWTELCEATGLHDLRPRADTRVVLADRVSLDTRRVIRRVHHKRVREHLVPVTGRLDQATIERVLFQDLRLPRTAVVVTAVPRLTGCWDVSLIDSRQVLPERTRRALGQLFPELVHRYDVDSGLYVPPVIRGNVLSGIRWEFVTSAGRRRRVVCAHAAKGNRPFEWTMTKRKREGDNKGPKTKKAKVEVKAPDPEETDTDDERPDHPKDSQIKPKDFVAGIATALQELKLSSVKIDPKGQRLGKGVFGSVFAGETEGKTPVAIKVMFIDEKDEFSDVPTPAEFEHERKLSQLMSERGVSPTYVGGGIAPLRLGGSLPFTWGYEAKTPTQRIGLIVTHRMDATWERLAEQRPVLTLDTIDDVFRQLETLVRKMAVFIFGEPGFWHKDLGVHHARNIMINLSADKSRIDKVAIVDFGIGQDIRDDGTMRIALTEMFDQIGRAYQSVGARAVKSGEKKIAVDKKREQTKVAAGLALSPEFLGFVNSGRVDNVRVPAHHQAILTRTDDNALAVRMHVPHVTTGEPLLVRFAQDGQVVDADSGACVARVSGGAALEAAVAEALGVERVEFLSVQGGRSYSLRAIFGNGVFSTQKQLESALARIGPLGFSPDLAIEVLVGHVSKLVVCSSHRHRVDVISPERGAKSLIRVQMASGVRLPSSEEFQAQVDEIRNDQKQIDAEIEYYLLGLDDSNPDVLTTFGRAPDYTEVYRRLVVLLRARSKLVHAPGTRESKTPIQDEVELVTHRRRVRRRRVDPEAEERRENLIHLWTVATAHFVREGLMESLATEADSPRAGGRSLGLRETKNDDEVEEVPPFVPRAARGGERKAADDDEVMEVPPFAPRAAGAGAGAGSGSGDFDFAAAVAQATQIDLTADELDELFPGNQEAMPSTQRQQDIRAQGKERARERKAAAPAGEVKATAAASPRVEAKAADAPKSPVSDVFFVFHSNDRAFHSVCVVIRRVQRCPTF